jgi:hypothetical protein
VTTVLAPVAAPKKKHRGRTAAIVVVIVLAVLVAAVAVLDNVARGYAANLIQTKVRSSLSLPASTPVDVTVEGASVLLQLATGKLQQVDIGVPSLSVGALTGDAELTVHGIPIDQSQPIDSANLTFSTGEAGLQKLLAGFSSIPISTVAITSGAIDLGGSFTVFGVNIPVSIAVTPKAVGGELALTPKSFLLSGAAISPAQLTKTFGGVGADLTQTQKICIASVLPKAFHLDQISVKGKTVHLAVSTKSVVLNDSLFTTKGTCP